MKTRFLALLSLLAPGVRAQTPVFGISQAASSVGFNVKASVAIVGKFDKRDASLTFTSPGCHDGSLERIA